ncbi:hypothetical protein HJFPF1_03812 [Paramyrothecium foliicola]|nr:hypothetical protein HJFPF1_03812 [Paramyrothecium foliicola]
MAPLLLVQVWSVLFWNIHLQIPLPLSLEATIGSNSMGPGAPTSDQNLGSYGAGPRFPVRSTPSSHLGLSPSPWVGYSAMP